MILYHISAKKLITRCTFSMLAASLILCPAVFSGCSAKTENVKNTDAGSQDPISATAIKLNTAVTVTIYDSQDRELLTECMNLCDKYEKIFSRTADDSELYQLNHRELTPVKGTEDTYQVSASLAELVSKGLDYSVLSEGAFDIAIEPLTSLWDFTAENPKVPKDSLIQAALPKCNYHNISVDTKSHIYRRVPYSANCFAKIRLCADFLKLTDYLTAMKSASFSILSRFRLNEG